MPSVFFHLCLIFISLSLYKYITVSLALPIPASFSIALPLLDIYLPAYCHSHLLSNQNKLSSSFAIRSPLFPQTHSGQFGEGSPTPGFPPHHTVNVPQLLWSLLWAGSCRFKQKILETVRCHMLPGAGGGLLAKLFYTAHNTAYFDDSLSFEDLRVCIAVGH